MPIVSARVAQPEIPTSEARTATAIPDLIMLSLHRELNDGVITAAMRATVSERLLPLVTGVKNREGIEPAAQGLAATLRLEENQRAFHARMNR
jgi:hypothetical protein